MIRPPIEELAGLVDKATELPWQVGYTNSAHAESSFVCYGPFLMVNIPNLAPADAQLVVGAVNTLPALLAYVAHLESLAATRGRAVDAAVKIVATLDYSRDNADCAAFDAKLAAIPKE